MSNHFSQEIIPFGPDQTQRRSRKGLLVGGKALVSVWDFRYSTLAWIPETDGSWALPLRHERITSFETPTSKAAFQLKQVSRQLETRPLAAYDRGYGNAKFVTATIGIEADLLLRLASIAVPICVNYIQMWGRTLLAPTNVLHSIENRYNRCLWGKPEAKKGRGAPPKHGHKFKRLGPHNLARSR
ncbi:hypothetical protein G7B40_036295 [Aetokthonos hydrillicola Thurmond2011]|uniref:Transposase IS701-like DDE domain-containing protein n=1 Tax=Aetokthonos hydrillicola Thurmond2011 TaxID=2712845 RepID=A0AAP5MC58_9CYAN|nr:hypothetical protein [Aetokthonos hydrillicola]MBW4587406.1 hypothetical protein [Aetokthonos hydrillicola CCALA 1050]MDR9899975.1 hypothetical protein [Aetokthonos hydrillicola Thurmond2011]